MKNFIKKYPKRIIIIALVVLLIAVIGIVNNYGTYSKYAAFNNSFEEHPFKPVNEKKKFFDEEMVEVLQELYSDEELTIKADGVYYKHIRLAPGRNINDISYTNSILYTDKEQYDNDETLVLTLDNVNSYYVEFYENDFVMQCNVDNTWYTVRSGMINKLEQAGELVHIAKGENYSVDIPLEYVSEIHNEPVKLKKGSYRIGLLITHRANEYSKNTVDVWALCEFEIK